MVTILPIDVDEELVREGLQQAVAARVQEGLTALISLAADLRAGGLIKRPEWEAAFASLAVAQTTATPVLEYAKVFYDQWPDEADES